MDFNQSEKLLGKLIIVMIIAILAVVSISLMKFMGIFSLLSFDNPEYDMSNYVSETSYVPENANTSVESTSAGTVNEIDPRHASDSRFYGIPDDIKGKEPPEESGYPIYNKIFEDSLGFEFSTYAYEISLADNPLVISYTVEPIEPSVKVAEHSAHSGNVAPSGGGEDYETTPDDCLDCMYPIGNPYECFLKITISNPDNDEIIYTCGYSGDYSSNLDQWHFIPDHIDKARIDLEGNNVKLDLNIGAGRCEDLNSTMIMYRGYEGSSDAEAGSESDVEVPTVWWY